MSNPTPRVEWRRISTGEVRLLSGVFSASVWRDRDRFVWRVYCEPYHTAIAGNSYETGCATESAGQLAAEDLLNAPPRTPRRTADATGQSNSARNATP